MMLFLISKSKMHSL